MFTMTEEMREKIKKWVKINVAPMNISENMLDDLEAKMPKISVSRPTKRISWGVPVPDDPS